ncbi:thioesterase [Saccharopolyspora karakumensis]|uniref:Thioesterase n=1 Tax=Saccharopolyspora karakumensis TaxID=2530386 RepID=A0A4R5BRD8_9PSEU|nr:thioesterase family protein [Saccharopolyspora karakumensis]TDD88555.1 thioesterase [Saccharopolyspora karakumensis]
MMMRQQVRPEWIDYNGHLSEAYYVLVFGFATDALMERIGMDSDYLERTGCSLYTVEAHVRYLREVPPDSEMLITTRVVEVGAKKLRLCHEMVVDDVLRATTELVALHVDSEQGRTSPFPEDITEALTTRLEAAPDYAGRV